jgi:hypothetical protein
LAWSPHLPKATAGQSSMAMAGEGPCEVPRVVAQVMVGRGPPSSSTGCAWASSPEQRGRWPSPTMRARAAIARGC